MIHLAKSRRSSWAVLAAGALVVSVLVAAVVPAGAVTDRADHTTRLSACVGDAATDRMFSDVSAGHVFRAAINCVAYYGITQGTGDGTTYSPEQDVTRAQMAVFVARAARAAGVDLGNVGAAAFDDIDDTWQEAQDAINQLATAGMIPPGGAFRPDAAITRAEMATFLIGLLVEAAPNVTVDSNGTILLGTAGTRSVADDRFPDTSDAKIAALYELGVTRGASAAEVQDPTMPPLDLNYEPDGTVDRGQMAAFITRALSHTGLRPRGVSAQFDGADVVVSVRDDSFNPVAGAAVDVFWAPTADAGRVFAADGTCDQAIQADSSSGLCAIDETDPATASDGDARVAVTGLRRVPEGGAVVWAWAGQLDETVGRGTELHRLDVAEGADAGFASTTLVTTSFNGRKVRFGGSVLYVVQLRDIVGNVATGVNGRDPARWILSVQKPGEEDPEVQTLVSDSTGTAAFSISLASRPTGTTGDVVVRYTLTAADNAPPIDASGAAATGTLTFSDEPSSIAAGSATVTIETRGYVHVLGGFASNSATVTVLDQYGNPFPGAKVRLAGTLSGSGTVTHGTAELTVDGRGSRRFAYQYRGQGGETETLTPSYGATTANLSGTAATVHWTADAGPNDDDEARAVLAGDVHRRHIVVNDGDGPVLLVYDDNDRFNLRGEPTSMAAFEAVLAAALRQDSPGVTLEWSNYRAGSDRRVTEYDLS